jgi:hypothetical protein
MVAALFAGASFLATHFSIQFDGASTDLVGPLFRGTQPVHK